VYERKGKNSKVNIHTFTKHFNSFIAKQKHFFAVEQISIFLFFAKYTKTRITYVHKKVKPSALNNTKVKVKDKDRLPWR
jgi:hypothetical protein